MSDEIYLKTTTGSLKRIEQPEEAGWWVVDDWFRFSVKKKPNIFQRLAVSLLLGWEWKDKGH